MQCSTFDCILLYYKIDLQNRSKLEHSGWSRVEIMSHLWLKLVHVQLEQDKATVYLEHISIASVAKRNPAANTFWMLMQQRLTSEHHDGRWNILEGWGSHIQSYAIFRTTHKVSRISCFMTSYFPWILQRIFRGDVPTVDIEVKIKIKTVVREICLVLIN